MALLTKRDKQDRNSYHRYGDYGSPRKPKKKKKRIDPIPFIEQKSKESGRSVWDMIKEGYGTTKKLTDKKKKSN